MDRKTPRGPFLLLSLTAILLLGSLVTASVVPAQDAGAVFSEGPNLNVPREAPFSAALPAGGLAVFGGVGAGWQPLDTAEIYDPGTNSFTLYTMNSVRQDFALARLADGRFLLAGGIPYGWGCGLTSAAEIFDPATNSFTATGSLNAARGECTAATLKDGRVLVVGSWFDEWSASFGEVFAPDASAFTPTAPLNQPCAYPVILPTADGGAVVAGGHPIYGGRYFERVEYYDPATNSFTMLQDTLFPGESGWTLTAMHYPRPIEEQRLSDGRYLLYTWNQDTNQTSLVTFDPATRQFARFSTTLPVINIPIVDNARARAYYYGGSHPDEYNLDIYLDTVQLATGTVYHPTGSYHLSNFSTAYCAFNLLSDGRLMLAGGSYWFGWPPFDTPSNKSYFAAPLLTPAEINVSIDIKPGSSENSINPKSQGKIPVAILSTPDFDAPDKVDLSSLTFGRTGNEDSLAFVTEADVNGDGLDDVVGHFFTQAAGFQKGDTKGYLKGKTVDGIPLSGSDSVRIVPGK